MSLRDVSGWRRIVAGAVLALLAVIAADLLFPPPLHLAEDASRIVRDRDGRWLHAFPAREGRWRFHADLEAIDPVFVERLIAIEDKRFYEHPGVDAAAVVRAARDSLASGRIVSGASTITMQTARLLEPRPRTIGSKLIEMVRALQIERRLSKREILSLYLTLAPYGGNLEGVRAASLVYFDKEPSMLTDAEQALLIALPQAPEARRPDLRPDAAASARRRMLRKFADGGLIDEERAAEAGEALLPAARRRFPQAAYHFAAGVAAVEKSPADILSTIDIALQHDVEATLQSIAEVYSDGAQAAAVIVHAPSMEVVAHVGAADRARPGGWMDLTGAVRSPGSLLKPFIYGLAMDDGRLHAASLIEDMPRQFGDYSPENFDRVFRGEVRMREALQHSLNVPAVHALRLVGARRFAASLEAGGISVSRPSQAKGDGLALALGGAGVSARDMAALYAGLAQDGAIRPLKQTIAAPDAGEAKQFMSADAALRVSAILRAAPSLEGRAPAALAATAPLVAFKTGTSYGYRDAWAAGHAGDYAIVVWVGRADGASRPGATGRKTAAPILFDLFDIVAKHDRAGVGGAAADPEESAPPPLLLVGEGGRAPEILFPRDGVALTLSSAQRGVALSARADGGSVTWFVDGSTVEMFAGRPMWKASEPGFYRLEAIDSAGRSSAARVRVLPGGA